MVELFGIYAVLLAGWGLYRKRRASAESDEAAAAAALYGAEPARASAPTRERGDAARRHLGTTS